MTAETENSGNNQTRMAKNETDAINPEKISSEPRNAVAMQIATGNPETSNTDEALVLNPKYPPRASVNPGSVAQIQGSLLCKPLESDFNKTLRKLSGTCS